MGEGEEAPEREGDQPKRGDMFAHIIARHFKNLNLPPIALGRHGLCISKAHSEIAMGRGINSTLPPMACADRRRQPFGRLEINNQPMGREAPIDKADHRNGDIIQADFNLALIAIGIRQAILPEFGERAAHIAGKFLRL